MNDENPYRAPVGRNVDSDPRRSTARTVAITIVGGALVAIAGTFGGVIGHTQGTFDATYFHRPRSEFFFGQVADATLWGVFVGGAAGAAAGIPLVIVSRIWPARRELN